jgi:hypothetical protein
MSNYSTDNEVYGTNFLTGAVVVGSVIVLLAFLAGLSPQTVASAQVSQVTSAPVQEIVIVSAPRHGKES